MAIRHFPYLHPVFGTIKKPSTPKGWTRSVYYWWWEYLRRNVAYQETCNNFGLGKCANIYNDFGDIFSIDFKDWWTKGDRGAKLFANQPISGAIVQVDPIELEGLGGNEVLLKVNMNIPRKFLEDRFKTYLNNNHKGRRGHQDAKKSNAKYKFSGQPNLYSLQMTLQVYDAYMQYPDLKLWEIPEKIPNLQVSNLIGQDDSKYEIADKKNRLSATVGRYLQRAKKSIANAGEGVFP